MKLKNFSGARLGLSAALLAVISGLSPAAGEEEGAEKTGKIQIVAERFQFTPSRITVKEGTSLEIELISEDTYHGFRMGAAGLNVTIPPAGQGSLKILFRATKKGKYAFECSRPCGAGHTMMRGVIVVE